MAISKTDAINAMIAIAKQELGYLEKKSNSQLDSKTANAGYNNYTKYWRDVYPAYQGSAWCAAFVSWVLMKAFGLNTAKKMLKHWPYVYCPTLGSLFTKYANPQVGDIVIFYRGGTFAHTGIVIAVSGDKFTTIEGNTSGGSTIVPNGGGVYQKSYYNSNLPGTKFCRLDWSLVSSISSGSGTSSTPSRDFLQIGDTGEEVKALQKNLITLKYSCGSAGADGDFGSGTESAVKKFQKDNGLTVDGQAGKDTQAKLVDCLDKNYADWVGSCTADGTVVYANQTGSTTLAAYPSLNKGNLVDVLSINGDRYRVNIRGNKGYVNKSALEKANTTSNSEKPGNTTSTASNAIIHDGQIHSKNFTGFNIAFTGIVDANTKKVAVMVLQTALNHDYNAGLEVDGVLGSATKNALGNHFVHKGEIQYLVTAVEILLMLNGYNPNGVECPGSFGNGLETCVKKYQKDKSLTVDGQAGRNTILSLVQFK